MDTSISEFTNLNVTQKQGLGFDGGNRQDAPPWRKCLSEGMEPPLRLLCEPSVSERQKIPKSAS